MQTLDAISGNRQRIQGVARRHYTSEDLQVIQMYEDKVNEIIMILEANNDIMQSIASFYTNLMKNDDFDAVLKRACMEDVREFAMQVGDMIYDANMQIRRARLLVKITTDRKSLVCLNTWMSTIFANRIQVLQHLQGQATEATLDLTWMSYKEATIMRIITIVTLIFLPETFASVSSI